VQAEALLSKTLRWDFGGGFYNESGLNPIFYSNTTPVILQDFLTVSQSFQAYIRLFFDFFELKNQPACFTFSIIFKSDQLYHPPDPDSGAFNHLATSTSS
jgi:hypothetical protein